MAILLKSSENFVKVVNSKSTHDINNKPVAITECKMINTGQHLKHSSKSDAKDKIKKRFKINDILILKGCIKDGSEPIVKKFIVKQVIWSIKDNIINALILKQLSGINYNKYTLNRKDCKRYHIKYEPGLMVYPMSLNFIKCKK